VPVGFDHPLEVLVGFGHPVEELGTTAGAALTSLTVVSSAIQEGARVGIYRLTQWLGRGQE
jgi:hypothetical protein